MVTMMAHAVALCVLVVVLCLVPSYSRDLIMKQNDRCYKYSYILCPCGTRGNEVVLRVKMCLVRQLATGRARCQPCHGFHYTQQLCNIFRNCKTCASGIERCVTCPTGTYGTFCTEEQEYDEAEEVLRYPIRFRIPRGGDPSLRRDVRATSPCPVPKYLDTADMDCTLWTNRKECTVSCIFGYTYSEGISRSYECVMADNKWEPGTIEECKPYVNCGITLKSAGDMNCTYGGGEEAAKCEISCSAADGNDDIPPSVYTCQLGSSWNPPLPFCITKTNETSTVPEPKVPHKQSRRKRS